MFQIGKTRPIAYGIAPPHPSSYCHNIPLFLLYSGESKLPLALLDRV